MSAAHDTMSSSHMTPCHHVTWHSVSVSHDTIWSCHMTQCHHITWHRVIMSHDTVSSVNVTVSVAVVCHTDVYVALETNLVNSVYRCHLCVTSLSSTDMSLDTWVQQDAHRQRHRQRQWQWDRQTDRQTDRQWQRCTCTESFDNAGSGLHLIECYWLYCVRHKLQLSTQCTMSSALRRWLNKLVEYISTVATTCVLQATNHTTSLKISIGR